MKAFENFRALPLTVQIAIVFLLTFVLFAVIAIPQIAIPFLMIVGVIGSVMRIFIYIVEERK
jgi:hypothetical protein